MFMIVIL